MYNAHLRNLTLACAIVIAGLFAFQGMRAYDILDTKAKAQRNATDAVAGWKATYRALRDSRVKWDNSYYRQDKVQDLVTLLAVVDFKKYGLETDDDNAIVSKMELVRQGETELGLQKYCVATGVGDGGTLFVRAPDYQALLTGLGNLARRRDIYIGSISLQGNGPFPFARLGDFCVFLRIA